MGNSIQFVGGVQPGQVGQVDSQIGYSPGADLGALEAVLGNNARNVSPPPGEGSSFPSILGYSPPLGGRLGRFFLQSAARDLLPDERVARCLRVPIAGTVSINWGLEHKKAFFSGLETCSSVWCCPVCGTKIAERRRVEIGQAISVHTCLGGLVVMITFTIRHHRGDDLMVITRAMVEAHRQMRQGKAFQNFKQRVGYLGTIRALEVTHGQVNGWHPHIHELLFLEPGADLYRVESFLRARWSDMLKKVGLRQVNTHGFSLDSRPDAVQTLNLYMSKLGDWDLGAEMTRACYEAVAFSSGWSYSCCVVGRLCT